MLPVPRSFLLLGARKRKVSEVWLVFLFSRREKGWWGFLSRRGAVFILFFARGDCLSHILRFLKFSFFSFLLFYVFRTPLLSPRSFRYVNTCPHLAYTCIHLPTCAYICFNRRVDFSFLFWYGKCCYK